MKRFRFRLQPVLDVRSYQEEVEQLRLAELLGKLHSVQKSREALEQRREEAHRDLVSSHQTLALESILRCNHLRRLSGEIGELLTEETTIKDEIHRQRKVLREASRKSRLLTRLKERGFERHTTSEGKKVQSDLDEMHLLLNRMPTSETD